MDDLLPTVLVPGLAGSARLYAAQIPALWRFGPVSVVVHSRDATLAAIARRILADAPPRFALAGLSMGGYIAFEILRQAPARVLRLALLDTSARPDTPEQSALRHEQIALAESGRMAAVLDQQFPRLVHPARAADTGLRELTRLMFEDVGTVGFVCQQRAIMSRPDSRPTLALIRCPTLVLVGEQDALTPPPLAQEMASGIDGACLVRVPECGHLSALEQPDAVNQALAELLSR